MKPINLEKDLGNAMNHKIHCDLNLILVNCQTTNRINELWYTNFSKADLYQHIFSKGERQLNRDLTNINNVIESL